MTNYFDYDDDEIGVFYDDNQNEKKNNIKDYDDDLPNEKQRCAPHHGHHHHPRQRPISISFRVDQVF